MSQLVELNPYIEEIEAMGYSVYGVSPSDPQGHRMVVEGEGLDFDILTDEQFEFGTEFGFIDMDSQAIYRGYTAVNPETNSAVTESDYLVGENRDEIMETLEDL
ncbi:peroxiredoxin family protein [Salipaludibacillus sp. CUR1]|uniref:peroxiredoxin family protein n=1 Tax=Salipaludibacillus sp. CUR1 TaxID=2820003 RepID=UPI00351D8A4A